MHCSDVSFQIGVIVAYFSASFALEFDLIFDVHMRFKAISPIESSFTHFAFFFFLKNKIRSQYPFNGLIFAENRLILTLYFHIYAPTCKLG